MQRYVIKRSLLLAVLVWLIHLHASAQQHTLADIENRWISAIQQQDSGFLNRLLSDDFTDVTWKGSIRHKKDMLHFGKTPIRAQQLSELQERIYDGTGIVNGINTVTISGLNHPVRLRFTDVFIRQNGTWHAVSAQESLIQ